MLIAKNTVVTLSYKVTDSDGNLVDDGRAPLAYLHGGYDGIFPKIEETLHGKAVGEKLDVKLQPDDAFGEYDAELLIVEPRNLFPGSIEVGMQFERATEKDLGRATESGDMIFTITDITDDKVVIDGNHPLAGQSLIFTCEVTDVRPATTEELAHGHTHGPGGHHH